MTVGPVESAAAAAVVLSRLEASAWVLAGFEHLVGSGALSADGLRLRTAEDEAAARLLAAVGLVTGDQPPRMADGLLDLLADGSLAARRRGIIATLHHVAAATGVVGGQDADDPAGLDDAAMLAQRLATVAVPSLAGLSERFAAGGVFLNVGVRVAEMAVAFCAAMPNARVVGIDVVPRALALARQTIGSRGLQDRVEVRLQAVEELFDVGRFDLAWMPAASLPEKEFHGGLRPVYDALRPGGWLIVGADRFDGDDLAVAVTRWRTLRTGGTSLTADEARAALGGAGFVDAEELPSTPGAPAMYAARRRSPS